MHLSNQVRLDDWDASAVLTTRSMFSGWSKFNKDIGTWDLYVP